MVCVKWHASCGLSTCTCISTTDRLWRGGHGGRARGAQRRVGDWNLGRETGKKGAGRKEDANRGVKQGRDRKRGARMVWEKGLQEGGGGGNWGPNTAGLDLL